MTEAERKQELINYIQNVTKGTIHQHSPHTQDLLRYLKDSKAENERLQQLIKEKDARIKELEEKIEHLEYGGENI